MANLSPNLQSILDNRLRYLPAITGQAINSIDWSTKLIEIGHRYGLHIDEMEDFQGVVLKSMIGIIPPEKFEDELLTALALSPVTTERIIEDINSHVFEPIHDYVMNQGKPADPLKKAGIVLTTDETPTIPEAPSVSQNITASSYQETQTAPATPNPGASMRFEDFFVVPPTTTDHSLGIKE